MNTRPGRDRAAAQAYRVQLPLLDRLIDDDPDAQQDPPVSAAEALAVLRHSVRRDIEALLNARRRWRSWPSSYEELAVSPVGYGISDFAAGAFNDPAQRERLCLQIEDTIRRFEPRLAQVRVVAGRYGQPARSDAAAAHRGAAAHRAGARSRSRSTRWSRPRRPKCRSRRLRATGRRWTVDPMSDALLPYYDRELNALRRLAAEFAEAHPKIAGRLRLAAGNG